MLSLFTIYTSSFFLQYIKKIKNVCKIEFILWLKKILISLYEFSKNSKN